MKLKTKGFEKYFMKISGVSLMILMGLVTVVGYEPDINAVTVFVFYQFGIVFGFVFLGGVAKLVTKIK